MSHNISKGKTGPLAHRLSQPLLRLLGRSVRLSLISTSATLSKYIPSTAVLCRHPLNPKRLLQSPRTSDPIPPLPETSQGPSPPPSTSLQYYPSAYVPGPRVCTRGLFSTQAVCFFSQLRVIPDAQPDSCASIPARLYLHRRCVYNKSRRRGS